MELNKVLGAVVDYTRCKDKILKYYILDMGDGTISCMGNENELADLVFQMILSVDEMIRNV